MVLIVAQFRAAYKKEKTMKEPTLEEVLELVSFWRDGDGELHVHNVDGCVLGDVKGNVYGDVGIVHGNVSDVFGTVWGISSNKVRDKVVELKK